MHGAIFRQVINDLLNEQYKRIQPPWLRSVLLHSLFWFVWLARNLYDVVNPWGWNWAFTYTATVFLSQMPLAYLHLYVLVPYLLNRRRYISYAILTCFLVIITSWLNYELLQALPRDGMPDTMVRLISLITPNFNVLEGLTVIILTYALKYTLVAFLTQNELLKLQKEKLQLELSSLKAQVHPHFLFNTLNNLYSLTLTNNQKASAVVLKLSDIMRYVLYEANEDRVSLKKELDFINNYVALQRLRYTDKYRISISINGESDKQQVAPLLFIDFVENAFKHGLDRRFNDGFVEVEFNINGDEVIFRVRNSMSQEETTASHSGIGLSNIRRRLELIYNGKYSLRSGNDGDIHSVELTLQLN